MPALPAQCMFRRSRLGNLWWEFGGLTLTVFSRDRDGYEVYGWCIACGNESPRFTQHDYGTEDEAIEDLWEMITW